MSIRNRTLLGALLSSILVSQLLAQAETVCLQRNRVVSWRAVDQNTVVYTDRQRNEYTVTFKNLCSPLTQPGAVLIYRNQSSLSCIKSGDSIGVKAAGYPGSKCRVADVRAGAPG